MTHSDPERMRRLEKPYRRPSAAENGWPARLVRYGACRELSPALRVIVGYILRDDTEGIDALVEELVYPTYLEIPQIDVVNRIARIALQLVDGIGAVYLAVLHIDVVDVGYARLVGGDKVFPLIEHIRVYLEQATGTGALAVTHVYMMKVASAPMVGLQIHHAEDAVGSLAVFHQDITHAGTHLAAYAQQTVTLDYLAVANDDILRRLADAPGIAVATRLDDDGIVALVEAAVFYQHVARHL